MTVKFNMDTALKMAEMEAKAILQEQGLPPTVGRDDFIRVRDSGDRLLKTAFNIILDCRFLRQRIDNGEAEAAAELAWSIGAAVSNMRILREVPEYRQTVRNTLPTDMGATFVPESTPYPHMGVALFPRVRAVIDAKRGAKQQRAASAGGHARAEENRRDYQKALEQILSEYPRLSVTKARYVIASDYCVSEKTVERNTTNPRK